jgi:general secretion pathway protein G
MRKGFTLVELLIVIVIIGILASAMMLSSGAATASAEATTVISELRSLRAAALMFYGDNMMTQPDISPGGIADLVPYMDSDKIAKQASYKFDGNDYWWVGIDVSGRVNAVKTRLGASAQGIGLWAGTGSATPTSTDVLYTGGDVVWMRAR